MFVKILFYFGIGVVCELCGLNWAIHITDGGLYLCDDCFVIYRKETKSFIEGKMICVKINTSKNTSIVCPVLRVANRRLMVWQDEQIRHYSLIHGWALCRDSDVYDCIDVSDLKKVQKDFKLFMKTAPRKVQVSICDRFHELETGKAVDHKCKKVSFEYMMANIFGFSKIIEKMNLKIASAKKEKTERKKFNNRINCKLLNKNAVLPKKMTKGSAGFDLYTPETFVVEPRKRKVINLGIAIEIPDGYEGQVRSRSGLATKKKLIILNAPGTIDSDYRGELKIGFFNLSDVDIELLAGSRVAQLLITKVPSFTGFNVVDEFSETTERGEGGFGSTGD